jgi:pimeloyl-ACP methyl ester carboxylesterase
MSRCAVGVALAAALPAYAQVTPFPASFHSRDIATNGSVIHVRQGGKGLAVVLLHGFGDTGDMWEPLAVELARDHTVIVPDLRGFGLSSHPDQGYDKRNQAMDIVGIMDSLGVDRAAFVAHDIGNMVAFAVALWHPHQMPRLVAGRERIYLDRFYDELSANPARVNEGIRVHYAALYARPNAMHDAFENFKAFPHDADDNRAALAASGKLAIPSWPSGATTPLALRWPTSPAWPS